MILVSGTSFKDPSICSKRWITLLKATQLFDFIIKIGEGPAWFTHPGSDADR